MRFCTLFVASYDLQGYGGDILSRLHMAASHFSLYSSSTDLTENAHDCFLVAGETGRPRGCFLATADVLLPVYAAVTWQRVCVLQNVNQPSVRFVLFCAATHSPTESGSSQWMTAAKDCDVLEKQLGQKKREESEVNL
jgi:hypothetical protein